MRVLIPVLLATGATAVLAQAPVVGPRGEPAKKVAVYTPKPEYPDSLKRKHIGGAGVFVAHVDIDTGTVSSVSIRKSTGVPALDEICKNTFMRWRFIPRVVERKVVIPIRFVPPSPSQ
jgi:TonB family protein